MKLRNKILAMAIVAVASVNAYLANDVMQQRNDISLMNLENIAEGYEFLTWNDYAGWVLIDVDPMSDGSSSVNIYWGTYSSWGFCDADEPGVCSVPTPGCIFYAGNGQYHQL